MRVATPIRTWARGVGRTLRRRPGLILTVTVAVALASVLVPPALLSVARKPVDYFTFNPWLKRLPEYLATQEVSLGTKLDKLSRLALFWFSSDSPMGGTEWGFAVDVADVARIVVTAALFALYFGLWTEQRALARAALPGAGAPPWIRRPGGRAGGVAGAVLGLGGLSTGPCSVMGCGAPVLPVLGLAFVGLSSGTLKLLAQLATAATVAVLGGLVLAVAALGWSVGRRLPGPTLNGDRATRSTPAAASPR